MTEQILLILVTKPISALISNSNTPLLFGRHMYLDLKEGVSLVQVDGRLQEVHPWQHEDGDLS